MSDLTVLVGLNGSGKSSVLQCLDFVGALFRDGAKGDGVSKWLETRDWKAIELKSKLSNRRVMSFGVEVEVDGVLYRWDSIFNPAYMKCTWEKVVVGSEVVLEVEKGHVGYRPADGLGQQSHLIPFKYEGSILSQLEGKVLAPELNCLRDFVSGFRSFDMLAPQLLRKRQRNSDGSIGLGGELLSAFVAELDSRTMRRLISTLKEANPVLEKVSSKTLRAGWKQLDVTESYADATLRTEARHVNDGFLRLLALLAQLESTETTVVGFDEVENGINPELVEMLVRVLTQSSRQIVATTHSPLVLNFLDDELAKKSVVLLFRDGEGASRALRFFDIPSQCKKLEFMGAGQVFIDTDLVGLTREAIDVHISGG